MNTDDLPLFAAIQTKQAPQATQMADEEWHPPTLDDQIATLLEVLKTHALDPTFEKYGNFIMDPGDEKQGIINKELRLQARARGDVRFFGNFFNLSHVFNIDTNNPKHITDLTAAIRANQKTLEYQRVRAELIQRDEILRHNHKRQLEKDRACVS